jgi:hypothetical protein
MLQGVKTPVYYENCKEHVNEIFNRNSEFLNVEEGGT